MKPLQVVPSTTSHKLEPLDTTLEVFSRLGLRDLDLNLHHFIETGVAVEEARHLLTKWGHHVWVASGGWCDYSHDGQEFEQTRRSVERQVAIARELGVRRMRLFFGRLPRERYGPQALETLARNISELGARHPDVTFAFENHDGASACPEICRAVLERVDRANIRLNFDPINFEHRSVDHMKAFHELQPFITHVHLKGIVDHGFCEFGDGNVDLTPFLGALIAGGYRGGFTVEYEADFDRTVRLFRSTRRATDIVSQLAHAHIGQTN
jgi:sugar phosphate isomerase/epimerase